MNEYDWRSETRVLVDAALEVGGYREVSAGEVRWVLESAANWAAPAIHQQNGSTIIVLDWITIAGTNFYTGDWKWPSDRMFSHDDFVDDVVDTARWLQTATHRITHVDPMSRSITIGSMIEHRLVTARDLDGILETGRMPPTKSRVPAHVQQNRPRLDGRRR